MWIEKYQIQKDAVTMHYTVDTPCGPIGTPLQASETVAHDAEDFSGLDRLKERLAAETKDPGQSNGTNQPLEACNHEILNINAQICSNMFLSSMQSVTCLIVSLCRRRRSFRNFWTRSFRSLAKSELCFVMFVKSTPIAT